MQGILKRSTRGRISFRILLSTLLVVLLLQAGFVYGQQQESFNIYVVGEDRSLSGEKLQAAGHNVTWEQDALQIKLADLSQFDQVWFVDIFAVPDATGRANLVNFIKSGGKLFFVGDSYKPARAPLYEWRDSLFNELGAGGIKQSVDVNPSQTIYYTNPFHVTSYVPYTVHYIEHGEGRNGSFEETGNGTVIVGAGLDATGTPIAVAFNYGDLTEAPHSRAVVYLNSNMYTNWDKYVANLAKFLGSKDKTILQAKNTSALPGNQGHLKISLHNSKNVSGLQLKVTDTPDAITPLQVFTTDRTINFNVSWQDNQDGTFSVVLSSQQGASIPPGTGSILNVTYQVNDNIQIGDSAQIQLTDVLISDEYDQPLLTTLLYGTFHCDVLKGDVIMDGIINIVDLVRVIDIILGRPPEPSQNELDAADYNGDGEVNILDVVAIINTILGREPAGLLKIGTDMSLDENDALKIEETVVLPFRLNHKFPMLGTQVKLVYDNGEIEVGKPVLTKRSEGMTLITKQTENEMDILLVSFDGKMILPGNAPIFKLPVKLKNKTLERVPIRVADLIIAGDSPAGKEFQKYEIEDFGKELLPSGYDLAQNYPNPFNMNTEIQYQIPEETAVKLTIYNLLGKQITALVNENQQPGIHKIRWDGKDSSGKLVTSGIYFYQLKTENFQKTRKLTILK